MYCNENKNKNVMVVAQVVQFFQLSALNEYNFPALWGPTIKIDLTLRRLVLLNFSSLFHLHFGVRLAFATGLAAVLVLMAALLVLGYQFANRRSNALLLKVREWGGGGALTRTTHGYW
jgi:hypothetical protein